MAIDLRGAEPDRHISVAVKTLHEITRIAGAILSADDYMALMADSLGFARSLDLVDQISETFIVISHGEGLTQISAMPVTEAGIMSRLGEIERDK